MENILRCRHYIRIDAQSRIEDGWSDGPFPEKETEGAILLREDGGYQFRIFDGGDENPALKDPRGVHLWKWQDGKVLPTTKEERREEAFLSNPPPEPDAEAILQASIIEMTMAQAMQKQEFDAAIAELSTAMAAMTLL